MAGAFQHYLQAAFMGGFGRTTPDVRARSTPIAWRRVGQAAVLCTTPENVGARTGMYRLRNPPLGIDRDAVDRAWDMIEARAPSAILAAAARTDTSDDQVALLAHLAACLVRHPDYDAAVNRWLVALGQPAVTGDQIHIERVRSLLAGLDSFKDLRWRLLYSPPSASRFIVNDLGWTYIGQSGISGRALFAPLNSRVALLGQKNSTATPTFDRATLRPSWIRWLNAGTWAEAPNFVLGHPDDEPMLKKIVSVEVASRKLNVASAFVDRPGQLFAS